MPDWALWATLPDRAIGPDCLVKKSNIGQNGKKKKKTKNKKKTKQNKTKKLETAPLPRARFKLGCM